MKTLSPCLCSQLSLLWSIKFSMFGCIMASTYWTVYIHIYFAIKNNPLFNPKCIDKIYWGTQRYCMRWQLPDLLLLWLDFIIKKDSLYLDNHYQEKDAHLSGGFENQPRLMRMSTSAPHLFSLLIYIQVNKQFLFLFLWYFLRLI